MCNWMNERVNDLHNIMCTCCMSVIVFIPLLLLLGKLGSALLFIVRSRLLVYSAGSGMNRVQVVLSGFSKRLFCFVQAKTLCSYGYMYFLAALVLVCVDVLVMSYA